jgi:predicted naringenin-chalcone synthase
MKAVIRSLTTANPPLYVTQQEAFESYTTCFDLQPEERELYRRILLDGPGQGRYIGMDSTQDAARTGQDELIRRFQRFGRQIAAEAGRDALRGANVRPDEVQALVTNTCTGYICPGMSSYLVEDLQLSDSVRAFDLMGMGCGGALPNLDCAVGALARGGPVLSVAFEICSATLFMGPAPDLVVSNCIFADGAAAAVLDAPGTPGLARLIDSESGVFPQHREALRYRWEDGRLRNTLSPRVPAIGARTALQVATRLLERQGLGTADVHHWVVHPGGTVVLDRIADAFGLPQQTLQASYDVFREFGNMSSASVLFVLRRILESQAPRPGELGLLLSFGAGFSAYAALVAFGHDDPIGGSA